MALRVDLEAVIGDEGVRFRFAVANEGAEVETLTFRDAGKADFVVYEGGDCDPDHEDADGREERWRWSEGRMFAQAIETERLEPGTSSTYEGRWDSPDPGTYFARATLRAQDRDLDATCELSIGN